MPHSDNSLQDWFVSNRLYEDNLFYYALIIGFFNPTKANSPNRPFTKPFDNHPFFHTHPAKLTGAHVIEHLYIDNIAFGYDEVARFVGVV